MELNSYLVDLTRASLSDAHNRSCIISSEEVYNVDKLVSDYFDLCRGLLDSSFDCKTAKVGGNIASPDALYIKNNCNYYIEFKIVKAIPFDSIVKKIISINFINSCILNCSNKTSFILVYDQDHFNTNRNVRQRRNYNNSLDERIKDFLLVFNLEKIIDISVYNSASFLLVNI